MGGQNEHVRCNYCKELIRWDAVKCKHCHSTVVPHQFPPSQSPKVSREHAIERPFSADTRRFPVGRSPDTNASASAIHKFRKYWWFWGLVVGSVGGVVFEIVELGYVSLAPNIEAGVKYGLGWGVFGLFVDALIFIGKRRVAIDTAGVTRTISLFSAFEWTIWLTGIVWFGRYLYLTNTEYGLHWMEYVGEASAWGMVAFVIGLIIDFNRSKARRETA